MNMLPIFLLGVVMGIALSSAYYNWKKSTPSEIQVEAQLRQIDQLKNDNNMLMTLNKKLYDEIDELKQKLNK